MDSKKLLNLIKRNEGEKLDFKEKLELVTEGNKKEFVKDVCAIANSRGGRGYIIIGIQDRTKKIIGVTDNFYLSEEKLQQVVTSRTEPPIPIALNEVLLDNKKILVVTIYNGYQKPYQVRESGAFYIRRGSTTDIMRKIELISAFQQGLNFNIEVFPIVKSSADIFDEDLLKEYFQCKSIKLNDENKTFLLNTSNITVIDEIDGTVMCTLGGLLVFAENNSIYLPHNMIKIVNKSNKDKVTVIQGTLISMINRTEKLLIEELPHNYPVYAVIEAVKNAVLYRDYSQCNKIIEIIISRKSLIVSSPGQMIKRYQNSYVNYARRNMWIYEKLITLDKKQRFLKSGTGIVKFKKAFKGIGKVKVIDSKEENCVKVIMPGLYAISNM
ncbi:helix-turn-helix domain-containing protein [Clostridium tarantellae]|uniref:ATP-binding protein n=1 Tax=Clostridium tarantellae TaxID=39493 RepID=A0A6I1MK08_9CLOT|nr:RNA-binding domain-containing protein [Clostridium tarantellae]MPQ43725.1 ATP-binding protein [Clostridium tarantellae]